MIKIAIKLAALNIYPFLSKRLNECIAIILIRIPLYFRQVPLTNISGRQVLDILLYCKVIALWN